MTYCPLTSMRREQEYGWIECIREQCGFWDWKEKQCAMVSIAIGSMEHIREKEGFGR